jgi:hypothetical protein
LVDGTSQVQVTGSYIVGIGISILVFAVGAIGLIVEMAVLTPRRRRRPTGAVRTPLGHGN